MTPGYRRVRRWDGGGSGLYPVGMPDPHQTLMAMQRAAAGTPFEVIPFEGGCAVTLALGEERWWPLFRRVELRKTYTIEAYFDPAAGTAVTRESQQSVFWRGGVPYLAGHIQREIGRVTTYRRGKRLGMRLDGSIGVIDDYRLLFPRLRSLVQGTLKESGWRLRLPSDIRAAVWIGVGAVVFGVVVALAAVLFALL